MLMKNFLAVSLATCSIICGATSISAQTTPSASDKDQMDKIKSEIEKKRLCDGPEFRTRSLEQVR
jgi:hypothetical protein